MFWHVKKAYLLVFRDKLQIYLRESSDLHTFSFPPTLVHNLELVDQIGFEKSVAVFFEQKSISHLDVGIILDDQFLFWKRVQSSAPETEFFSLIPLPVDQIHTKQSVIDTDTILCAYNSALLGSIQRVLYQAKCKVNSIIPFYAIPAFESGEVDITQIEEKTIRRSSLLNTEILLFKSKNTKLPLFLFSSVFSLLLIGGLAYFVFNQNSTKQSTIKTPVVLSIPSPSPTISYLSAKEITIDILNGSGKFGEAGRLKTSLEKQDFSVLSIGTAPEDISNTLIAAKKTVPHQFIVDLTDILKKQYVISSHSAEIDLASSSAEVVITIGKAIAQ